jgi:hypothetical protein
LNPQSVYKSRAEHSLLFLHAREGNSLLNPLAAALNQDGQYDYRKDSGDDSNNNYIVHVNSPFSINEVLVKTFHYGDSRRTQSYQKEGGKDKEHKREDKFYRCLRSLFLYCLATLSS